MKNDSVFNSKVVDNDQIIVEITAGPIVTTYIGEAPNSAAVTDKVWKIRKVVDDSSVSGTVTTVISSPVIDWVVESNANCIRDDGGSNIYDSYTYTR